MTVDDKTPILVGSGQYVEREATLNPPMHLAAQASAAAIADTGGSDVAAAIDTIAVVKIFSDSAKMWACPFGGSDNPPQSVAAAIGASPKHRVYSVTGGNQPQSLVIEMASAIARGEKSMVLLTGAEAIRNQRTAQRNNQEPDWNEHFDEPLEDRGFGEMVATLQEIKNGGIAPIFYYSLMEQARRARLGLSVEDYLRDTARLLESFSQVAANNPYSQFTGVQSAQAILSAGPLTHLYTRRMIAQDGVNQAASLLLCSVGKGRELGIPEDKWVYLHGMAEGAELDMTNRPDISVSPMAAQVVDRALGMAEKSIGDIDLIDIYSCFPCAVTAISDHLGLPADGSTALTLTGGLPYFGGAGNNYSMHALAEVIQQVRLQAGAFALVTTNGGMLSKHASGVFSCQPGTIDWATADTTISNESLPRKAICEDPGAGTTVTYSVNYMGDQPVQAMVLAETDAGERFVCCTASDDQATVQAMLDTEPTGRRINVTPPEDHTLHFQLTD